EYEAEYAERRRNHGHIEQQRIPVDPGGPPRLGRGARNHGPSWRGGDRGLPLSAFSVVAPATRRISDRREGLIEQPKESRCPDPGLNTGLIQLAHDRVGRFDNRAFGGRVDSQYLVVVD